jgi:hypothetical protein
VREGNFRRIAAKDGCHVGARLAPKFEPSQEGGQANAPFGEFGLGILNEGVMAAARNGAVGSGIQEDDGLKDGQFVADGGYFVLVGYEQALRNSLLHGVFFLASFVTRLFGLVDAADFALASVEGRLFFGVANGMIEHGNLLLDDVDGFRSSSGQLERAQLLKLFVALSVENFE